MGYGQWPWQTGTEGRQFLPTLGLSSTIVTQLVSKAIGFGEKNAK